MKVAAVGAGAWGRNIVRTLNQMGALAAVVEADAGVREKAASEAGVQGYADIADLDPKQVGAVAIATPAHTHHDVATAALARGFHAFVEKPLCLRFSDAEALCDYAEQNRRILMVGHLLLYHPAVAAMRAAIKAGRIGTLISLHQERLNFGRARPHENALWSLGVHDVAVALQLVDAEPAAVQAVGKSAITPGVADDVSLHVTYANGVQSHLHVSWLWPERRRRTTAIGTLGMLVLDEIEPSVLLHSKAIGRDLSQQDGGTEQIYLGDAEPLRLELEHFLACCESGAEPLSSGRSALPVLRILEQADEEMRNG